MRHGKRAAVLLAPPTVGLGIVVAVAPDRSSLAVHIWLLVAVALGLLTFVRAISAAYPITPSPFTARLRRPVAAVERPQGLVRLEREVSMAGTTAFDLHHRLRPVLIELATGLLASRRGIDLTLEPERARAALGDETWELVRPERPQPTRRAGPGIDDAGLGRVIASLEAI